jgi:predicted lysophospholipase L1 biosynthesis ABC-type transport system permease subunit
MTQSPAELLEALNSAGARLPNRTLFQLAMAGLRARLARSVVTETAVVLAIAYLSYSGVMNDVIRRMAESESPEVYTALRAARINVEATRAGNPLDRWLVVMALLTCAVGIANAMLMSVTERFREIGTMKCLGAENATVVKLFLIESSLLGVVGSVAGIFVGAIISLVVGWVEFGGQPPYVFEYLSGKAFVEYGALSFLAGVALCLIGAGYPALVAARMRPVEALRVEE